MLCLTIFLLFFALCFKWVSIFNAQQSLAHQLFVHLILWLKMQTKMNWRGLQLGKRKRGEKGEREEGKRIQKVVKSELTLPFKYSTGAHTCL